MRYMRHQQCIWHLVCVTAMATFFGVIAAEVAAESVDERFIAGLNERRLFSLSQAHCRLQLSQQPLAPDTRVDLTIALCRTYAEHALHTPRSNRDALWNAAAATVADFRRAAGSDPRAVLVEMQLALTTLARGELARQEAEIGAPGAPSLDEARRELQSAVTQLKEVGDVTERLLRNAGRGPRDRQLTESELISLQRNIAYQHARALRNQALCYPPKSPERSDTLIRALERLRPLAKMATADALVWNSRLDEAVCLRRRAQWAEAAARLDTLQAARPPSRTQLLARGEKVRIYLDAARPDDAFETLKQGREIGGRTSADYDLAHVETYIALWKKAAEAKQMQQAEAWQQRASAMVQAMEQLYGPYWTRRGEMLLAASAGSSSGRGNLDVLVRAAKNHYLRKEFDEAVGAYGRAAKAVLDAGDNARAFDLYHAAALIERQRGNRAAAIRMQRNVATILPEAPKAALVHLQATLDAAQLARDGDSQSMAHYVALLDEHIKTWPNEASADKARLWSANLRQHQHDWAGALSAYRDVSAADEQQYLTAIDGSARCYMELLSGLRAAGQSTEGPADRAARFFENILLGGDTQFPERFAEIDRRAALQAARLRLRFTSSGFDDAQRMLEAALRDSQAADATWRSEAHALLVVAQAGAGNRDAAARTLAQLSGGSPTRQLEMLRGLRDVAQGGQPPIQRELAALQLEVVNRLKQYASRLSDDDRKELEFAEAHALAAAGRRKEAVRALARLSDAHTDDAEIQTAYAEILLDAEERASLLLARDAWRNVLRRTRPNTPPWYEAKYATALAHFKLGQHDEAAKMIELLATVQPEMGGIEMKRRFVELLERCR